MPGTNPQTGDVIQVTYVWTCQNQIAENTVHFSISSATGGGLNISDIAAYFAGLLTVSGPTVLPSIASFYGVKVRNLSIPQSITEAIAMAAPGTVSASVLPKQVCGVCSFYSALAGPRNRGRLYLPFLPISFGSSSGQMSVAGKGAWSLVVADMAPYNAVLAAAGATTTLLLVIRHGRGGIIVPTPAGTFTTVSSRQVQGKLGTQRKRGDYGRTNVPDF